MNIGIDRDQIIASFGLSYWETIKNSQSADDFKAYLARYPQGQFAELAKNRSATLQLARKPVESKPAPVNDSATELAFWDSVKNSTDAEDFRAYLQKYPNGAFTELAKNRLAPLEAGEKEKVKADEIARNTKSFKGHYLRRGAWTTPGTLIVTPNKIQFAYRPTEKPTVFQCSDISAAKLEGVFVRDIRDPDGQGTMRFEAESAGMAADALAAMKFVCANPGVNFSGSTANNSAGATAANSLEGTTWTGGSPGGDKHYEFRFQAGGVVVWNQKMSANVTYEGIWVQNGNAVTMSFRGLDDPVLVTIQGNQMSGTWYHGRYQLTVTKVQ